MTSTHEDSGRLNPLQDAGVRASKMLAHCRAKIADQALEPADPGLSEKGSGAAQQRGLRTTGRADQGCTADCSPVDGRWIQLTGKGTADSLQFISIEYTH
ncbi:hypothetical protein FOC34_23315 [Burkholderia multivorans]|uniref:hypothetical protein n=1 Tax=Burkholderia multivorans TaxID=87883 RepID=UPI0012D9C4DB|nr:hypothetical protein [Burkholderia multivorans]QGR88103.1 hypothetical protein FOC34_23315 [Burkholderia multivorans]